MSKTIAKHPAVAEVETDAGTDKRYFVHLKPEFWFDDFQTGSKSFDTVAEFKAAAITEKPDLESVKDDPTRKEKRSMADTLAKHREGYVKTDGYNGLSINCGDDLASILAMFEPERVMTIAERALSLEPNDLHDRYAKLNPGQKRMNAGNRLRAALKKGTITINNIKAEAKALVGEVA